MSSKFDLEVCRRVPLADAGLRLLDFAIEESFLDGVFERHRDRSYESVISFSQFVRILADVLLGHRGSAHQTFQQAIDDESLEATVQAMYGKLRRIPLTLSLGLFAEATLRLRTVATPVAANPLPASLASFWALGFDGKKIKYVAKRLKPLRGLKGNILGGKLLVVQDMVTQQAVAANAVADGEAGDNPLVPTVVAQVRSLYNGRLRLWVGDRSYSDYKLLGQLSEDGDQFLVRYNTSCEFHRDSSIPARTGTDDEGRRFREEWGCLGKPNHKHRIRVRMITIIRNSNDPLIFVTSLLDADRYPAIDLLTLYRSRWGIEVMFQQAVQTFDLRDLIGSTPQATVFQAMLCLLLYNITLIIRDYVAVGAKREPKTVSLKLLFDEVVRDMTGCLEVIGIDATIQLMRTTKIHEPELLKRHLKETLADVWQNRWQKAPTRKRPPRCPPRAYLCGGHSSVDKILRGVHKEIPLHACPKGKAFATKIPAFRAKKDV